MNLEKLENLKKKIFYFGIFGDGLEKLNNEELLLLKDAPWTEIVTKEQINSLRENFHINGLEKIELSSVIESQENKRLISEENKLFISEEKKLLNSNESQEKPSSKSNESQEKQSFKNIDQYKDQIVLSQNAKNLIIRLNTVLWRNIAAGEKFVFRTLENFLYLDYLIRNDRFIENVEIRQMCSIAPKKFFSITKLFRIHSLIEENVIEGKQKIKYKPIDDKLSENSEVTSLFTDETAPPPKIILYSNISIASAIENDILLAKSGLSAKDLCSKYGMNHKSAGKLLCAISAKSNNRFVVVDEVLYKYTVYKYYTKENFEEMSAKKIKRMQGESGAGDFESMSQGDRQRALRILCEKYRAFILDKAIIAELTGMTGYKYDFDKRNLVCAAKNAGLKVFEYASGESKKYIIYLPEIDEDDAIVQNLVDDQTDKIFKKLLRQHFLHYHKFTAYDNLFPKEPNGVFRNFYEFLKKFGFEKVVFDYDVIKEMGFREYISINKTIRAQFRELVAESLFHDFPENFKEITLSEKIDSSHLLFYPQDLRNKLCKIYSDLPQILEIADKLKIDFIRFKIPEYLIKSIERGFNPKNYIEMLNWLDSNGLIIFEESKMTFQVLKLSDEDLKRKHNELFNTKPIVDFPYKERCDFLYLIRNIPRENFVQICEKKINENYSGEIKNILLKRLSEFAKIYFSGTKIKTKPEIINAGEIDQKLYKYIIFKLLQDETVSQQDIFNKFDTENINSRIDAVMGRMIKNGIIGRYSGLKNLSSVKMNLKFRNKMVCQMRDSVEVNENSKNDNFYDYFDKYYNRIYKIVSESETIDFDHLLHRLKGIEEFEILEFLQKYNDVFDMSNFAGFKLVSLKEALLDPFSD